MDFSASVSPLGPPDGVREAIAAVDLGAYPDPHCLALNEAIATYHTADGVTVDNVIVGNGSTEIIHLLTRANMGWHCPIAGHGGRPGVAHRGRTESPNAGWTMAAMAGGLGVTLEKIGHYRLGDPAPEPLPKHIGIATRALYGTTALSAGVAIGLIWLRWSFWPWW